MLRFKVVNMRKLRGQRRSRYSHAQENGEHSAHQLIMFDA
jgi:hypothetical protein